MPRRQNDSSKDSFLIAFGLYGGVGFQLAFAVVGGLYVGSLVDDAWGTEPWLTLLGLMIGAIGGFYNLIRIMQWNEQRKSSKQNPHKKKLAK